MVQADRLAGSLRLAAQQYNPRLSYNEAVAGVCPPALIAQARSTDVNVSERGLLEG